MRCANTARALLALLPLIPAACANDDKPVLAEQLRGLDPACTSMLLPFNRLDGDVGEELMSPQYMAAMTLRLANSCVSMDQGRSPTRQSTMTIATVRTGPTNRAPAHARTAVSASIARTRGISPGLYGPVASMTVSAVCRRLPGLFVPQGRKLRRADPECCDGSDEWATGACPNTCQEIGKEYRARVEAETKTRKTVGTSTPCPEPWADRPGSQDPRDVRQVGGRREETPGGRVDGQAVRSGREGEAGR